ncbi:MAG: hypothetical protein ACTSR8_18980 [Promethearchaeota archaeon]
MNLFFFIKSETIDISHYTIKDIPGSSGRLDVITRCILAAIKAKDNFENNVQIWVFLNNYKTIIFDPNLLDYNTFPNTELLLTNALVETIKSRDNNNNNNNKINENYLLNKVEINDLKIIEAIEQFQKQDIKTIILNESGVDFYSQIDTLKLEKTLVVIIGNQSGNFLESEELKKLRLPVLSFGSQSYLASSIIRLIKLHLIYGV